MALPSKGAIDQSGQLICSAVDGLVQGRRLVSDCDGLTAFDTRFHHTAHIVLAFLVAVHIAHVHFHSRDVITESTQGTLHYSTDLIGEGLVTSNVVVSINLYLHGVLLW
jgi:hypothetical protein